ncbi:SigE family RNA polymerase sigma factor [Actinotalea subterranea]|uniref:SigE family RNA polymerase sigma factor n=1 Tax=Actinotalea subterranea TaxID=2607497 RepID=UPI001FEB2F9E|nr:SigE family RNA polymerase sigma factor [Actinotalea subterranea]
MSEPRPGDDWLVVTTDATYEEEFVAFIKAARDPLYRMAYLLCGDHHRAEDLTQQTFERTWRSWRTARRGDPLVWARRILANLRVDTWRRTRREVLSGFDPPASGATSAATGVVDDRDAVVRALLLLPVKQRRVVVLRHLLELSEAEVAAELGIPVGTVKSSAARGLARLRHTMDESGTELS